MSAEVQSGRNAEVRVAPIALFAYNRPGHLRRTIEALAMNKRADESELIVFSDGPRDSGSLSDVEKVRTYLKSVRGFRAVTVIERASNAGLARSIIEGVTAVSRKYGRVIVLEDDLVTSPQFLGFMNRALAVYETDERVASIHGYCYPVSCSLPETFFLRGADCWGWATWHRAWSEFEPDGRKLLSELKARKLLRALDLDGAFPYSRMLRDCVDGKIDSWAIRWHVSCFLKGRFTLYPGRSLIENIGHDGSGIHCGCTEDYSSRLADAEMRIERMEPVESDVGKEAFSQFLRRRQNVVRRAGRWARGVGAKWIPNWL